MGLGHLQQISMCFVSWLCYCTDVTQWRSTKLCTMFGRLLGWYISGALAPITEFCQVQSSLCVYVLHSPILAALLHGTQAVGVKVCGYHQRAPPIFQQRAPPIFGRVAIMLDIGSLSRCKIKCQINAICAVFV